ncbi:DUF6880 family protein [Rubrivivax albus]|uniref:Uncharacterized protein n=1 Tax=Rubrivivax albus TaxID=2499835 RepID=A0A437JVA2_9BURK|nr:DUF6880 family protein [Rubrivivax albus]RVT51308.1 hypothetical protein ENE75_10710 [Rubrivivax albus]
MATRKEDLSAFIRRQNADTLSGLLLELASEHPEVQQRLERLQLADKPDRLAATFRKTLNGWRRQTRFLDYRAGIEWATEAEAWLSQIERELLPRDPMAAVALAEAFIECDESIFNRADDSSGRIGDAMRSACRLWLQAAARCESPADAWPARLRRLAEADKYGAREALWLQADLLLSPAQLRDLVAALERELDATAAGSTIAGEYCPGLGALTLLSHALRDPDIHVRATLRRSPKPNSVQKQDFVLQYLDVGRPADALPWLEDPADWHPHTRLRLLAEVLKRLGQLERSGPIQQQVFEQTLSVDDFRTWLGHLAPAAQTAAFSRARELALDHDDPVTAARLLVEIGCFAEAEQVLVAEPARITGQDYSWLVPLAKTLEAQQCWRGATAVVRALLDAILAKAYSPAYGHAARYWHQLHAIAKHATDWSPLQPHAEYIAALRQKHARKTAFWAQVAKRQEPDAGNELKDDDA